MNYYRRYIGDFQRDTGHLSLAEVGAYDRLLDHAYATEKPLPASLDVLCRIARAVTPEEKDAVASVARQFFPLADGERRNRRAEKEMAVAAQARENGAKGGRPKTGERTEAATGALTGQQTGTQTGNASGEGGETGHPPTTNHQPPTAKPPTRARAERSRGSRLPADWQPGPGHIEFCRTERPDLEPNVVAARFRDFWIAKAGTGGSKLDWDATWRNWVRNEKRLNGGSAGKQTELQRRSNAAVAAFAGREAA